MHFVTSVEYVSGYKLRLEFENGSVRLADLAGELDGEVFEHSRAMRTLGVVGGRAVVVATAKRLRELHEGYEPREVEVHDLHLLADL